MPKLFHWLSEQEKDLHIKKLREDGFVCVSMSLCYGNMTGRYAINAGVENGISFQFIPASIFLKIKKRIENKPNGKITLIV